MVIETIDDAVVAQDADVIAAAAEAIRRSGAHAVEQFSDFAEISTALGDQEASDLWAELAVLAKQMLIESARYSPRGKKISGWAPADPL